MIVLFVLMHLACVLAALAPSINNGIGLTPPMGWRHWKAFYAHIDQEIMQAMMDELAQKRPVVNQKAPTSLADLGYIYAGLDDHWQNCTRTCANGTVIPSWDMKNGFDYLGCDNNTGSSVPPWHAPDGTPLVDTHRFPDLRAMTSYAHARGLRAGWYFGNYQCRDAMGRGPFGNGSAWDLEAVAAGAVATLADLGFDSVKIDSGFPVGSNMSLWASLLNRTGRPVMIENCHQGGQAPGIRNAADQARNGNCTGLPPAGEADGLSNCPFTFWRTCGDPEPGWGTIMRELNSMRAVQNPLYPDAKRAGAPDFNDPLHPRSRPGGWAYPGTMVVGDGSMTYNENAVHMGGWCIVSSPLILAFNLSDAAARKLVWPLITNTEAIQINQAWAGHPGRQALHGLGNNSEVEVWVKPLGEQRTAALIVNAGDKAAAGERRHAPAAAAAAASYGGPISLRQCNESKASQSWALGDGVIPGHGQITNVNNSAGSGCWEITACNTNPGAQVGTGYGCKPLPKLPCSGNLCSCNGAWRFNGSAIVSVMDGQCLAAEGTTAGSKVVTDVCSGGTSQSWVTVLGKNQTGSVRQGSLCVDNDAGPTPAPGPPPPPHSGSNATVTVNLADLNLGIATPTIRVRDVWQRKFLPDIVVGSSGGTFTTDVPHHGSVFLVFMPAGSSWPLPFKRAAWMDAPATD